MPEIGSEFSGQTVLTTFEVTPGTCQDLVDELAAAYADVITKCPGFIGSALHVNDAQTRVASYSQWRGRPDFMAMLRLPEMRERNRRLNALCKSFEPVMYDVVSSYD
jgi:heme-degrading monooxygenase HmoA